MKRVFLFLAVNFLVVVTISLAINLLGLKPWLTASGLNYMSLLVFCALFGFGGSFISLQLSRWMAKTAMGVHLIDPKRPGGEAEAFLVEKVRALSTQAGIEVLPEIGIYDSPEVNAFATGPSKNRALVAVSTGLLDRMDSTAVEGVLGHEISHVANGDMVTLTLIQGVLNTFVIFLARIIGSLVDGALRGNRDDDSGGGIGYFITVTVMQLLLGFLASLIVMWFSRWREFRADAGGASLAGRQKMISALERLSAGHGENSLPQAVAAFGISGHFGKLLASHPPIEERIAALRAAQG